MMRLAADRLALAEGRLNGAGPSSASASAKPAVRTDHPDIVINGRFYGQPLTGVQRYGREIVSELDTILSRGGRRASLVVPTDTQDLPPLAAIVPHRFGPVIAGHLWEQGALPFGRNGGVLLNLCNTGPGVVRKQVLCIHDTNVFTEPGSYRLGFRSYYRALQPWLAQRAAAITTVSKASAVAIARQFGLPLGRIAVLPNGHEHALRWRADQARIGAALGSRPFVLALGSRARHKNLDLLLGLAEALDALGLDLVVTGEGSGIFAGQGRTAGRSDRVRWLGRVSDDDLAWLFSQALCLAFPSWTEGFGLPLLEAMVHGCPVVASDRASMPEVCGSAALLAAPDDPAAWLSHIAALRNAPALRDELRERGFAQARRFSWASSAEGYLDLLGSIA
jgi:glycosyltransferase involved in cell wall biosynthesis